MQRRSNNRYRVILYYPLVKGAYRPGLRSQWTDNLEHAKLMVDKVKMQIDDSELVYCWGVLPHSA